MWKFSQINQIDFKIYFENCFIFKWLVSFNDLESEVPGSILTWGNILSLDFLLSSDANIGIIANSV